MNFDSAFLKSARRRLELAGQRIRDAKSHAHWHPRNEWEAFTGEPQTQPPNGAPSDRVGVAGAVHDRVERARKR